MRVWAFSCSYVKHDIEVLEKNSCSSICPRLFRKHIVMMLSQRGADKGHSTSTIDYYYYYYYYY